ncbi:arylsulfatase [Pseudomonas sp. R5(2019)]|uniref:arylsulfatase n=1 Tax=Pseudomonas sp. R5(2019) TaxID=2697566 RepID=UPI0014132480|nr:arylsulfatase [Pseudomonas sp. R5(2019)]NBA96271.1 sulfatase-like hydrolase/transferase [Pseudomonas sp. R5(2019)]
MNPLIRKHRLATLSLALMTPWCAAQATSQPNVLLIVADDLGYSDIGAFGGEIDTPNLDRLIKDSRQLQSLYVAPTCSPTRSMLMSGTDHHLAGVGNMAEMNTPHLTPEQQDRPGYEGYLNQRIAALPQLMKDAGYNTYTVGKWHLGGADGQRPAQRGFEQSYSLMGGGAAHFNQSAPMQIASSAPPPTYRENDAKVSLPANFYSSRDYTAKLIDYIDAGRKQDDKPFFAYAAYTAAHLPLQAPDEFLKKYKGRYDEGYDVAAERRIEKMKKLGLVDAGVPVTPMPAGVKPWASLSAREKAVSARTMEAYAAMVDAFDHEIGNLVAHLKAKGLYDNTLIVFLSDNGPEGNAWDKDESNDKWIPAHFDLALDNIGRPNSFAFQGEAWGQVSAQPFRFFKAYTHEGGIRSAAFIRYPQRVSPGQSDAVVTAMDIMPTILDAAGIKHPGIEYQGKTVQPMKGMSMLPFLEGKARAVHNPDYPVGFELMGRNAVRKGNWKIVYDYQGGQGVWSLYDLAKDPGELHDLAASNRQKLDELLIEWTQYVQQNNVISTGRDTTYPRRDY